MVSGCLDNSSIDSKKAYPIKGYMCDINARMFLCSYSILLEPGHHHHRCGGAHYRRPQHRCLLMNLLLTYVFARCQWPQHHCLLKHRVLAVIGLNTIAYLNII